MLRSLRMKHVALWTLREDALEASLVLAECGMFEPEKTQPLEDELPEIPGKRYRELYLSACNRLEKIAGHCGEISPVSPAEPLNPVEENELERVNEWLGEVWGMCFLCQEAERHGEEEKKRIRHQLNVLEKLASLEMDLRLLLGKKRFLDVHIGTLPFENVKRVQEALGLTGYLMTVFSAEDELAYAVIVGGVVKESEIWPLLQSAGWHPIDIPQEFKAPPNEARKALLEEIARVESSTAAQCNLIGREIDSYGQTLEGAARTLARATPYADLAASALRARGALSLTNGWVPRREAKRLYEALAARLGPRFVLSLRDPEPSEISRVPTLLTHPAWMRPFVSLVNNYGVPRYGEIDPTALFALSFMVMFGMMFGDVGQGAVILLGGLLLRGELAGYRTLAAGAGVAAIGFGLLYGSVFGYEGLIQPRWLVPLSDPIGILSAAIYLGIGFILITSLLTTYNRLADKRVWQALLDVGGIGGTVFYLGVIFGTLRWLRKEPFGTTEVFAIAVGFAGMLLYKWHETEGRPIERLLVGLIEIFEAVIGYVANTLSFMRIAAFSLNHAALAMAIFTLAEIMKPGGHLIAVLFGNLLMIVFEGAIITIQTLRLEYYEGFSRFFAGDGREFSPLRIGQGFGIKWGK